MEHTRIPEDELKVFESLTDIKVVFDVGARDDVDYLILKPGVELHCFEPNPEFFKQLKDNIKDTPNVHLNNFAAGETERTAGYNEGSQAINEELAGNIPVKRLDKYIDDHHITQIDFLKSDTEGYELKVIKGLGDKIKICRYIQYEKNHNADDGEIEKILKENGFTTYYTGYRNQIAVKEGEPIPWIPEEPKEGGQPNKDKTNYL